MLDLPENMEIDYKDNIDYNCIEKDGDTYFIKKSLKDNVISWNLKDKNNSDIDYGTLSVYVKYKNKNDNNFIKRYDELKLNEDFFDSEYKDKKNICKGQIKFIKRCQHGTIRYNGYPGFYLSFIISGPDDYQIKINEIYVFDGDKYCWIRFYHKESNEGKWNNVKESIESSFTFEVNKLDYLFKTASGILTIFFILLLTIIVGAFVYYKKETKI